MLVLLLILTTLSEHSGFPPDEVLWFPLVQSGLHQAAHQQILNHASNSFISICSCFCPQQVPPDLYHFVSFEPNDSPKLLCQTQKTNALHFPLTCRRQGIKQLFLITTHVFLEQWQINTDCSSATPSDLLEFAGTECPFPLKYAWGIQSGLSCLASCSDKPLAGAPVEATLLQHPWGEIWLCRHRVWRFATSQPQTATQNLFHWQR